MCRHTHWVFNLWGLEITLWYKRWTNINSNDRKRVHRWLVSPLTAALCLRWQGRLQAGWNPTCAICSPHAENPSSLQLPCPSPAPTGQGGLSKITEGTRLGEMNVFNKCQSAACFFSPVSSWSSVQRRYWQKKKYKCKSSPSLSVHMGDPLTDNGGQRDKERMSQRANVCGDLEFAWTSALSDYNLSPSWVDFPTQGLYRSIWEADLSLVDVNVI